MAYAISKNKYLNPEEFDQLKKLVARHSATRDGLLIELGFRTGGRASELLNIRTQDLDSHHQSVFIRGLKGSNDRDIPLPADLFTRLHAEAMKSEANQQTPHTHRVFPISYERLGQVWRNYRPAKKGFHSLRHTFAIELYRKTRDLKLVQLALGHRSIQNTIVYADEVYSTEEMKRLIL